MKRKRQIPPSEKNEVKTQSLEEEMSIVRQKLMSVEAELKLKNEEQKRLEERLISLEQQLKRKETELQLIKEPFEALPNEVVVEVFKHLTQNELGKIAQVCRKWNELIKSPVLWQKVDVEFYCSHIFRNEMFVSFINKLPSSTTSLKVKFVVIESELNIPRNRFRPLDFQELCSTLQKKCPSLQKLILHGLILSNTRPSIIHLCSQYLPDVTTLAIRFALFHDSPARVHGEATSKIEILDITGSDITHFSKPLFSKFTNLKQLYLASAFDLTDHWFEGSISFFNQLQVLDLGSTSVGSSVFRAIKNHGLKLKVLYMCYTLIADDDLKFDCSAFPQLKTVCINYCLNVTCEGVVSLVQSCPPLQSIYVDQSVARSYAEHPFIIANKCKSNIVKCGSCDKHDKYYSCEDLI